jgi:hypothetical protein
MKKIIILPLVLVGMLALTGCDSYGDFTLVEDSETAESKFAEAKSKNADLDDVSGCEEIFTVTGTTTDENEDEVILSATMTNRIGIEDSHFGSDVILTSSYGTYSNCVRFDSTENAYYAYMKLNFTYEDEEGTEVTIDKNMLLEEDSYSADIVFDEAEISEYIEALHMLSSMEYSEDMAVYTSSKGYYKFELVEEEQTEIVICDSDGMVIELEYIQDEISAVAEIEYSANLATINAEEYEERDYDYSFEFAMESFAFMTLSIGMGM